ncbi:D(1) dopamine receptor-like [Oculina patagonica]
MQAENASFLNTHEVWNFLERDKSLALAVGVIMVIMCPMIVVGNTLIILVVWKDPLRNLRSFTSSYILQSMAVADFLVGSILCPMHSYWSLVTAVGDEPLYTVFVPLAINAILISVSIGHVLLLTIDRLFALLAPLPYRVKVTSGRVCFVICTIWCYALVLGVFHASLADHFVIFSIIYTAQVLVAVSAIICINIVILCHFLRGSTRSENSMEVIPIRHFYQREKNLSKAIALIVCTSVVCFTPWLFIEALLYLCMLCRPNLDSLMKGLGFSSIFVYFNSLLNPFLYSWRLARFRNSLKHWLSKAPQGLPRHEPEVQIELSEYDTRL